jgi:hypothetical protein
MNLSVKQKAEELIHRCKQNLKWHYYDDLSKYDKVKVTKCALLIVDELIDESRNQNNVERFKYFREVKKEIENYESKIDSIRNDVHS